MERTQLDRLLAIFALMAIVAVAAIIAGIIVTGAGQDFFQSAGSADALMRKITGNPGTALGLRLNLGFDNLFIVIYAAYFTVLAVRFQSTVDARIITVALSSILLTALLDAIENHHILTMIHSVQQGLPVTTSESQLQMVLSNVKFHSSYLALVLFSLGFLREGGLGRLIAWVLWLYVALELVSRVMPAEYGRPFALGRTLFFVTSFLLSAIHFRRSMSR
jgi:hypothetical protein